MTKKFILPYPYGKKFLSTWKSCFATELLSLLRAAKNNYGNGKKTDCIIVGRCADYILKEDKPFRIFVYADMESKIKRCREKATEQEHLSDKELRQHIMEIDKRRAKYYSFFSARKWGDKSNYDLCINTTYVNIKDITQGIARMF